MLIGPEKVGTLYARAMRNLSRWRSPPAADDVFIIDYHIIEFYFNCMFEIKIKAQTNSNINDHFPEDKYGDLTIIATTRNFKVTTAYLSLDASYFASIKAKGQVVDFSLLEEEPLV